MSQKYFLTLVCALTLYASAQAQTPIQDGTHRNYEVKMSNQAEYPGGNTQLYKDLASKMQYPAEAKEKRITGDVMVSFFVEADSTTSEVRGLRDLGGGTKQEAERLIKSLKFAPAIQNGKPVRQQMMLPVLFRIYD
jgi:TonB family protein